MLLTVAMVLQMGLTPVLAADAVTVQKCACPMTDSGVTAHDVDCLLADAPACTCPVTDSGERAHRIGCPLYPVAMMAVGVSHNIGVGDLILNAACAPNCAHTVTGTSGGKIVVNGGTHNVTLDSVT